jgi:hypothetical protein
MFVYMLNNHCHRVTAQLQLVNIIIYKMTNANNFIFQFGRTLIEYAKQNYK